MKDQQGHTWIPNKNDSKIHHEEGDYYQCQQHYDPLGLGTPFLLKERLIIQQLHSDKLGWDQPAEEK